MKKRFAAAFAATAVLGVTCAFAANPFSDVTPNDWAYQSVAQLAAAGVINGYPDGTFKGQNNITRFEMAQMVAKAMANEARANAEQQALINRLADEFSNELNTLGVRVAALENKVGNVKVTGDARLRYNQYESQDSKFTYRARLNFSATVNENVKANVRVTTGNEAGTGTMTQFGDATTNNVLFDRANVVYSPSSSTALTVGRYGEFIGGGLIYDDAADGAKLAYNGKNFSAAASYAKLTYYSGDNQFDADNTATYTILQAAVKPSDKISVGGFYAFNGQEQNDGKAFGSPAKNPVKGGDLYGFNANIKSGLVWVGGEWVTNNDVDKSDAWVAGIGFGNYSQAKQGTWGVKAQYFDEDVNAPIYSSTFTQPKDNNYKAWAATLNYALFDNVGLSAFYFFNGEDQSGADVPDYYRAQLDLKF